MATIFRGPIVQRIARVTTLAAILAGPVPNLLATTLKPATSTKPFNQSEWPNPQIKQRSIDLLTEADASEFWILKDKIYRGVGQVPTYDWPNPRISGRSIGNLTDTGNRFALANTIVSAVPFYGSAFPNPAIAIPRSIDNLTSVFFYVLDDNQPKPTIEWPNPRLARRIDSLTWLQNLPSALIGPVAPPIKPIDWPNPQVKQRPIENITDVDASEFWLLKDQFFSAPGQPPTWDYPNPQIARRIDYTWNQSSPQSFAALQNPFNLKDWPNPGIPRRIDALTWLQLPQLVPAAIAPFAPIDWPNPAQKAFIAEHRTQADGTEFWLLIPANAVPFATTDWPNPGSKAWALENRTEADGTEFWILKDTFFGGAGQPPSPTPAAPYRPAVWPIDGRTWLQSHVLDTLAPPPQAPFNLDEWPVPAGYRYPISLRTLAEFTRLLGKDKIFGIAGQPISNFQQPNPLGYLYPIELRTEFARQTLTTSILALDAACIIQIGADAWVIVVPAEPYVTEPEDD